MIASFRKIGIRGNDLVLRYQMRCEERRPFDERVPRDALPRHEHHGFFFYDTLVVISPLTLVSLGCSSLGLLSGVVMLILLLVRRRR